MHLNRLGIYIILSFIFIIFTNSYFSFEQSLVYGGSDGRYYIKISDAFPHFAKDIEYIKGERFIFPYLVGLFSAVTNLDSFYIYQIFSILSCFTIILIFKSILDKIEINKDIKFFLLLIVIFNPYLARYFIAIPTSLMDSIFIISLEIILLGFISKKKNYFYLGILLSTAARQNGLIIYVTFLILKLILRKKSILNYKDLFYISFIFLAIFFLNTFYAVNSVGEIKEVEKLYSDTLFGIVNFDYSVQDFFKYISFPLLSFGPLIFFFMSIYSFKVSLNTKHFTNEIGIYILISSLLLIGIAFVGGPNVTGKNLLRLSNYSFVNLAFFINYILILKNNMFKNSNYFIYIFLLIVFLWSSHPTFSKFNFFDRLTYLFT